MKIVIEMPQEVIEKDAEGYFNYFGCMSKTLYETLKNGIVLPDNPTNGDMIKAMFPNIKLHKDVNHSMFFVKDSDWWNAPYERGEG